MIKLKYIDVKFGKIILGDKNEMEYSATIYFKVNSKSKVNKSILRNTEIYSFSKKRKIFVNNF